VSIAQGGVDVCVRSLNAHAGNVRRTCSDRPPALAGLKPCPSPASSFMSSSSVFSGMGGVAFDVKVVGVATDDALEGEAMGFGGEFTSMKFSPRGVAMVAKCDGCSSIT